MKIMNTIAPKTHTRDKVVVLVAEATFPSAAIIYPDIIADIKKIKEIIKKNSLNAGSSIDDDKYNKKHAVPKININIPI